MDDLNYEAKQRPQKSRANISGRVEDKFCKQIFGNFVESVEEVEALIKESESVNICSVNLATHKEKKALISLRKQKPGFAPQDVAAIIAQHNTQVSVITIQLSFSLSSLSPSSFLSLIRTRQCCHYHFLSLLSTMPLKGP